MRIELNSVHFAYPLRNEAPVFTDLACAIDQGELIGIIGKTGSGKSTFLQLCSGLLIPTSGEIRVNTMVMRRAKNWNEIRKNIGVVFQFPEKQLFEETVFADVAFGVSQFTKVKSEIKKRVHEALKEVALPPETFADRSPHHLSSGEQRRAALAGVLALQPEILFIDEPTIGLDHKGITEVESIINRLHRRGKTVCIVSHNLDFIVRVAKRILVIAEKTVKFDGPRDLLFFNESLMRFLQIEKPEIVTLCEELAEKRNIRLQKVFSFEALLESFKDTINSQPA